MVTFFGDKFRGGAVQFFGTKRHHDKWLRDTENYVVKGCFAMSELGHGSNVCSGCSNEVFYHVLILMLSTVKFISFQYALFSGSRN